MKTTTTLMDYFQSELIHAGQSEFVRRGVIVFNSKDHSFIRKVLQYDSDIQKITDEMLFANFKFEGKADKLFKQAFVGRFLNREIAFQTIEDFSGVLVYMSIANEKYIEYFFNNIDDFLNGKSTGHSKTISENDNTQTVDRRALESTLPQDNINLNVEDTILNYGDNNHIDRNKSRGNANSTSETNTENYQYNINNLLAIDGRMTKIFDDFDKKLFSQIN